MLDRREGRPIYELSMVLFFTLGLGGGGGGWGVGCDHYHLILNDPFLGQV